MANNRSEVTAVIGIFLKVKAGSDRAYERFRSRKSCSMSKMGSKQHFFKKS